MDWADLQLWMLSLSDRYGVDPVVFGSIYFGSSPLFYGALAWLIHNFRKGQSILMPFMAVGLCFLSAHLYVLAVGRNVPWWVYAAMGAIVVVSGYLALMQIRRRMVLARCPALVSPHLP